MVVIFTLGSIDLDLFVRFDSVLFTERFICLVIYRNIIRGTSFRFLGVDGVSLFEEMDNQRVEVVDDDDDDDDDVSPCTIFWNGIEYFRSVTYDENAVGFVVYAAMFIVNINNTHNTIVDDMFQLFVLLLLLPVIVDVSFWILARTL